MHTQPFPRGPAGAGTAGVCSPPAWPVGSLSALHLLSAQRGLGLLRRPPHMTCGELFRVEGAPRGGCSLHAALIASLLLGCAFIPLASCTTEKRGHSLSPEAVEDLKSSRADHPRPYKSPRQKVPTSMASRRHQKEMDHTGHVVQSSNLITSISGAVGHGACSLLQGLKGLGGSGKKLRALLANLRVKCQ